MNLTQETPISLEQAAEFWPARPGGSSVTANTVRRWVTKGVKIKGRIISLDGAGFGNSLCTSREALQRFSDAIIAARSGRVRKPDSENDKAAQELVKAGY